MADNKVWFITGASRGLGTDIAQNALAVEHSVVATGRNADRVLRAIGAHDNLLIVALDITDRHAATTTVRAAVDRLGRIDVLVNNAGNFYAGYFGIRLVADVYIPKDSTAHVGTQISWSACRSAP